MHFGSFLIYRARLQTTKGFYYPESYGLYQCLLFGMILQWFWLMPYLLTINLGIDHDVREVPPKLMTTLE